MHAKSWISTTNCSIRKRKRLSSVDDTPPLNYEKEQIVCKQFSEVDDLEQNQIFSVNLTTRNGIKLEDNARIQFKCNIIGNPPNALFHRHDDNGADDVAAENDWIQRYTLYHEGPIPMKEKYMLQNGELEWSSTSDTKMHQI